MNLLPGHEDCGIAVGVCNEPTFGRGILNEYGYWQFPCEECAREWERQNQGCGKAWPSSSEEIEHEKYKKKQRQLYYKNKNKNEIKEELVQEDMEEISQFV